MEATKVINLRDSAVIAIIDIFGVSYFSLFISQLLLFHFPSSTEGIIYVLSVLAFSAGVIIWCLSSLVHQITAGQIANWQKLEFVRTLLLICTTCIPSAVNHFSCQPLIKLGHVCAIILVGVAQAVDVIAASSSAANPTLKFPIQCITLGFLVLIPTFHAISQPTQSPSLGIQLGWVAILNALGFLQLILKPLERMGLVTSWSPSLYIRNLILMYSVVTFSRDILQTL